MHRVELGRKTGFDQNTDPRSTDPLLTLLLTPYKINGKMKIKKAQNHINGTRFKFINKFSLPETDEQDDGRLADFRLLFSLYCLVEVLLTENRAQKL